LQLRSAHQMLMFGRENNSPTALIAAAEVIGTMPLSVVESEKKSEKQDAKKDAKSNKPMDILAEAKEMSGNNPEIVHASR
jgi:hypothetical protein